MQSNKKKLESLKEKWASLLSSNKKIRIRDAADKMHVSEAELLSTEINEGVSFLLIPELEIFIKDIMMIDRIMLLIRSDNIVHEKTIKTNTLKLKDNQIIDMENNKSLLLEFDKKLFKYAFFQKKMHANRELRSFQFFNDKGHANLKIYLKGKDLYAFDSIALKYESKYNYEMQSNLNIESSDYVDFSLNIYLPFNIDRAAPIINDIDSKSLRLILERASKMKTPIQIHALGLGAIQYHMGTVKNIVDYGPWINIIDQNFNLHVLEKGLHTATLNQYKSNEGQQYLVNFFDVKNNHVLGISAIKGYDQDFLKIINNIKEQTNEF